MKRKEQKGTVEKVNPRESEGRNLIYNFGSGVRRAGCRAWGPSWHPSGRATPTKQATRTIKLRATCMCTRVSPQEPMSRRLSAMGAFQGIRIKFHSSWTNVSFVWPTRRRQRLPLYACYDHANEHQRPFLWITAKYINYKERYQKYNLARTSASVMLLSKRDPTPLVFSKIKIVGFYY